MHQVVAKLPAVSGSSGRLQVERRPEETPTREWPGQVFANPALSYEEAMCDFVAASQERATPAAKPPAAGPDVALKAQKRALRCEERQLRDARRIVREQRQLEDVAWQKARAAHKAEAQAYCLLSKPERWQQRQAQQARDELWRAVRDQRRATVAQRASEDALWRQQRLAFQQRRAALPLITTWLAILVVVDNCTRQCLGLPLFVAGPGVTAEMIVEALRVLLPPELRFLISDRGTHFQAKAFKTFALSAEFIHVLIARHRPQSNGIAERFVRTLKEWLADKSWHSEQALAALLPAFMEEYNARPHQGLPLPGLSPNEFASRIWLL